MSNARIGRARGDRWPESGAPAGRLHNCGSRPSEVFRTPVIGTRKLLDLRFAIAACVGSGDSDLDGHCWPERSGRLPERLVAAAARGSLQSLAPGDTRPPAGEDALPLLALLRDRLRERGTLRGLVGVAKQQAVNPARGVVVTLTPLAAALTLVAYASFAPPLLLWSRAPSLRWFRSEVVLEFHRFSSAQLPEAGE